MRQRSGSLYQPYFAVPESACTMETPCSAQISSMWSNTWPEWEAQTLMRFTLVV